MARRLEYFEVRVAGKVRGVCFDRDAAEQLALDIATSQMADVEVWPIREIGDRHG